MVGKLTLADIGEDALIARLSETVGIPPTGVGIGDDCAVISSSDGVDLLKTDSIIAGRHFLPETDAKRVGWKAAARVVSDFAAMGGAPRELLVSIALTRGTTVDWVLDLYHGIVRCARTYDCAIVGGETSGLPDGCPAVITISGRGSMLGRTPVLRSGGSAGDILCVTGQLGGSFEGHHLDFRPRLEEGAWLAAPPQGIPPATAMMDLSDGLAQDAARLARASGCGHSIEDDSLPKNAGCTTEQALHDGEDYELLVAIAPDAREAILTAWQADFPALALTPVGQLTPSMAAAPSARSGFQHFS